ncbi:hypothetical protein [Atopobacter phocae]|uniref:hypothetical protein n=1 Tax=Atopobacter phocae TaxID=136492 RepID=UPI000471F162|nr:hypothetical protein [Atopobacter phocae]
MENKRVRGFEVVTTYLDQEINLPQRQTKHSAGYDFEAAEDITLPSFWSEVFRVLMARLLNQTMDGEAPRLKPKLVPTGIKAYMGQDEYLQLTNRSSNPLKHFLILPNGVGIVDSDYYGNEQNEGHIYFQLINYGLRDYTIKKGERIGQGIFQTFLKADNEQVNHQERTGGFGSSAR